MSVLEVRENLHQLNAGQHGQERLVHCLEVEDVTLRKHGVNSVVVGFRRLECLANNSF